MESSKHSIRDEMSAARRALPAAVVVHAGAAVLAHVRTLDCYGSARAVLAYVAKDNEVPVDLLIADAERSGKRVYLPRVQERTFVEYVCERGLRDGPWGTSEPVEGPEFDDSIPAAVILVPLVAWDTSGARLGRGGGWYDRVLSRWRERVTTVGVGYAFQERPRLPQAEHDVQLDFIVTEIGVMSSRAPGGGRVPARRDL